LSLEINLNLDLKKKTIGLYHQGQRAHSNVGWVSQKGMGIWQFSYAILRRWKSIGIIWDDTWINTNHPNNFLVRGLKV